MSVDRSKIRILIAKPGLDGHDRGAKVIARALRDAGFEVVYTGLHQTPEMIINAAVDEDVQVIGMSVLSGAHNALVPEVISGVQKQGLTDALFLVGGIIPEEDFDFLKKAGVQMIFTPGASLEKIIEYIDENAPRR
ncbi:MAG: methylmalonyl-CoA mutase [Bdellovibrionaceae bacterium]|nr:methylmalonyl-CoA mutase [Pseudobdellovibrionaceae bacterium]